ncbi:hypothetical protein [Streptomyces sp. NPDC058424]|uniref:hypothetical protein n=1 Tax=Streptomyces sp. NPDC058424 TaxID=3346491 RepID=UPI003651D852
MHRKDRGELLANVHAARRLDEDIRQRGTEVTDEERERFKQLEKRGRYAPEVRPEDPIPLLALGQFYARDVPGLGAPRGCDLLQVLWCPFERHSGHQLHLRLVWRSAADVDNALTVQPEFPVVGHDYFVPSPCVLHPETVREYQYFELLPADLQARVDRWSDWDDDHSPDYLSDLSVAPGWKIGGFAKWNVTGPGEVPSHCGRPMRMLLAITTYEWDGGNRSWVPVEDRPNIETHGANAPTEIAVSRWGSMFVFVCAVDASHAHWIMNQ